MSWLSSLVYRLLPRPRLRRGAAEGPRRRPARIIVFARLPNPSYPFYLEARLGAPGMPPAEAVDIHSGDLARLDPRDTFVLVCRYATPRVLAWISRHAAELAGVGLFIDDDVPAIIAHRDTTWTHRLFLLGLAVYPLLVLRTHLDVIWTSTPALADRLGASRAFVLGPAPGPLCFRGAEPAGASPDPPKIVFYSQPVHLAEHRFLRPIISEVLRHRPDVEVEVVGDRSAARIWEGLPVAVVQPMRWDAFLAYTAVRPATIALVPLLAGPMNDVRAPTKKIDVTRLGAAGIYSASPAYGVAQSGRDGGECIVGSDPGAWLEAIRAILDDDRHRAALARASREVVEAMSREADMGLPGLTVRDSAEAATRACR